MTSFLLPKSAVPGTARSPIRFAFQLAFNFELGTRLRLHLKLPDSGLENDDNVDVRGFRERYWNEPNFRALEIITAACAPHGISTTEVNVTSAAPFTPIYSSLVLSLADLQLRYWQAALRWMSHNSKLQRCV